MESRPALAEDARQRLASLGYDNVRFHVGDGTLGWAENGPYDAILVTAGSPVVPPPLLDQLGDGGRLVLPLGSAENQQVCRVRRSGEETSTELLYPCRFVPLIGRYGWDK